MLVEVFSICAILLGIDGYYLDCDEKWALYIYDDIDVFEYCYPEVKKFHHFIRGCAQYDDNRGYNIILGNYGTGNSHTGDTVFWHEIKHLSCLCDYHASPPEEPMR